MPATVERWPGCECEVIRVIERWRAAEKENGRERKSACVSVYVHRQIKSRGEIGKCLHIFSYDIHTRTHTHTSLRRFNDIQAFENTAELACFDALGLRLFHGWVIDPQDEELVNVIGNASYNQLTTKVSLYPPTHTHRHACMNMNITLT